MSHIPYEDLYIRRAEESDREFLFFLSNDPVVRNNSIHREFISWEEHKKWFEMKLTARDYLILIAELNKVRIAQIRFSVDSTKEATISISLLENHRGKGLASLLISNAIKQFSTNFNTVEKIIAFIQKENKSSEKTFQKSGFHFTKDQYIDGVLFSRHEFHLQ